MVRVFENPDGSVRVVTPAPNARLAEESDADFHTRIMAKTLAANPDLQGLPFHDVNDSDLPARSKRYAWRVKGGKVVADAAVPIPPDRRQTLLDELDAAVTPAQIKAVLHKVIFG